MELAKIHSGESEWALEAGRYLIIDPCYILGHLKGMDWVERFCDDVFTFSAGMSGDFELEGHRIIWSGTAFGDGRYEVRSDMQMFQVEGGRSDIGVDAGMICIMPEALAVKLAKDYDNDQGEYGAALGLGAFVDVTGTVVVIANNGNWLVDGSTVINTECGFGEPDQYDDEAREV